MKKLMTKVVAPTMLIIGTLGLGATAVSLPAGAASKPAAKTPIAVAAKTYTGVVKTANVAKKTFTITSGTVTYVVHISNSTKFIKGSAASIKVGVSVSVVGKLTKNVVHAISISA